MNIISVREHPEWAERMIKYFQKHWASEESRMVYEDCITHCIDATVPLPQWYVMVDGETIIGCVGLITNDFISRMDLYPWICALYVEEAYRGHAYGSLLLVRAKEDAVKAGYPYVYLCTDHVGYYEKYGYEYIGTGYHPWGETSRIYRMMCRKTHKLLFGTGNAAKLSVMRQRLSTLAVELIGLNELDAEIPEVREDGCTPLENAEKKAKSYYQAFHMPVFSCDSGLYLETVPKQLQPGVHVRTVNDKYLSDEEMLSYYSKLVKKYGTKSAAGTGQKALKAQYRNAICLILDEAHIYSAMDESMASRPFLLVEKPHSAIRKTGFPLDSLSVDIKTGGYYYDLPEKELDEVAVEDGVLKFFQKYLGGGEAGGSETGRD